MSVTVYSTGPQCAKCNTVKLHLGRRNIPFTEVRIDTDRPKAVELRQQGFNQAPVLKVEKDGVVSWSEGYRPDFIDSLAS